MPHVCPACLLTCVDCRLHRRPDGRDVIGEFVQELGVDCDVVTRAGGAQVLARGGPEVVESVLRDLGASIELHQAKDVYLINHADCGAYRSFRFGNEQAEFRRHRSDLREAARLIRQRFPGVRIALMFGVLEPREGRFELRVVEDSAGDASGD